MGERGPNPSFCIAQVLLLALPTVAVLGVKGYVHEPPSGQRDSEIARLEPDTVIEQELSDDGSHFYRIELESRTFCRLVIDHRGVDMRLAVVTPRGQTVVDFEPREDGLTSLPFIATHPGSYRLELRSTERFAACGRYRVKIEELRPATNADEKRSAAHRAFSEGIRLKGEERVESSRRALDELGTALSHLIASGDKLEQARVLVAIGETYLALGEVREALDSYQRALRVIRELDQHPIEPEVEIVAGLGLVYRQLGDNEQALEHCTRALEMSRRSQGLPGEARSLFNLGLVDYSQGNMPQAVEHFEDALGIWRRLGDRRGQAEAYLYLGHAHNNLNDAAKAMESFRDAQTLSLMVGNRRGVALALRAQGLLCSKSGEEQKALIFYDEARQLFAPMGDKVAEAALLNGMAQLYFHVDEVETALRYYEEALGLFASVGFPRGEGGTLLEIGRCKFLLGDVGEALELYQRSLAVFRELGDERMEAGVLGSIGQVLDASGKKQEAFDYYIRALGLNRAAGHRRKEAETLNHIGLLYYGWGQQAKALESFKQALEICRTSQDFYGEPLTLYNMALAERSRGNIEAARSHIEAALLIEESLRTKVVGPDLRASFFASVHEHRDFYIDLLMEMHAMSPLEGIDKDAFHACERARARSLLDSLTEARVDLREGVDPELLLREQNLQELLNDRAHRKLMLSSGKGAQADLAAMEEEIGDITAEYEQVQALIRSKSPRYAALTQPKPLSLEEIQQDVIDDQSVLLEYKLGDKNSYLWVVTSGSHRSHKLPTRNKIEAVAERAYELLTARIPRSGESLRDLRERVQKADSKYWKEAAWLSKTLLGPVAADLGRKRLIVVSDGALRYLPFGALPVPEWDGSGSEPEPLAVHYEIVRLPSASTLAILRSQTKGRKPAEKAVAVLADPVFEMDDPRLNPEAAESRTATDPGRHPRPPPESNLQRALREIGLVKEGNLRIPRLPSTKREAEAIIALAPPGLSFMAVDFRASRAVALSPELAQYRIVHFATHGLVNNEHPELAGIVLSMVNEQGRPQDGFLRLHDIYNLELPVDMVVLSACNSGLGRQIRGEGLVGIVRGFMYAGAERVVASLWKVDDEATGELMTHFYREMLENDLRPAAALRQAQIAMWKQKPWRFPFFWAAFVLQGEWM